MKRLLKRAAIVSMAGVTLFWVASVVIAVLVQIDDERSMEPEHRQLLGRFETLDVR